jgi:hypothetical protein
MVHPIPENLPKTSTTAGQPQTTIEQLFRRLLAAAGMPTPMAQHRIDLGVNIYTVPDFFYAGDEDADPGICIYVDGMSRHIHGNPAQAEKDRFLREKLRSSGYEVIEVQSFELDDKKATVAAIARIGKYLVGKEKQRALRDDTTWFDLARAEGLAPTEPANPLPVSPVAPCGPEDVLPDL